MGEREIDQSIEEIQQDVPVWLLLVNTLVVKALQPQVAETFNVFLHGQVKQIDL